MKLYIPYNKGLIMYNKAPPYMKNYMGLLTKPIPRSIMVGSNFHYFSKELDDTQWYKPEELKKLQVKRLRALIKHAYINVPYYRRVFSENKISYEDIKTIEDLRKLPILTKEDIRTHFNELISIDAEKYNYGLAKTSGSTDKPLEFLLDQQNREMEYASIFRQLKWAGIDINSKIATFRGDLSRDNPNSNKPVLWRYHALSKELVFNTLNMEDKVLKKYLEKLIKFKPHLIKGYPSSLYVLAQYMEEHGIYSVKPTAIQTSSEVLSPQQRELIEEYFQCKIFDWYGQSEYVISCGECIEHTGFHINVESGILEFLDNNEQVENGDIGEMTATGFFNYSMPFIRYNLGDLGCYSDEMCDCGRGSSIVKSFDGRTVDIINTPDGKKISGPAFERYWKDRISYHLQNIEYAQVIQKSKEKILVYIVTKDTLSQEDTMLIITELRKILSEEMNIEVEELESIPTGKKHRFTRSYLSI